MKENVIATIKDMVSDFVYYDRKEDEDLPVGAIEECVESGEITVDEIVESFRAELMKRFEPEN